VGGYLGSTGMAENLVKGVTISKGRRCHAMGGGTESSGPYCALRQVWGGGVRTPGEERGRVKNGVLIGPGQGCGEGGGSLGMAQRATQAKKASNLVRKHLKNWLCRSFS